MTLLTTAQAADKLAKSKSRVHQLIRLGILPAERIGRVWAIKPEDVEAARSRPDTRGKAPTCLCGSCSVCYARMARRARKREEIDGKNRT